MDLEGIPLAWRERPFTGAVHYDLVVRDGQRWPTVAEIVTRTKDLPDRFMRDGEVRINGELVPTGCWHIVRPRLVHGLPISITLHMPMHFGGGGGDSGSSKNILALVATIAVLLVAAAVSGGLLAGAFGGVLGSLEAGSVSASLLSGALAIGGSLAIAALTPPPRLASTQAATDTASVPDVAGNPVSLTGNVLVPAASVPRVVGTHRVFPPVLSEPLIEVINGLEFGEIIYGLSGPHSLSSVRVGDVEVSNIPEMEVELQEGLPQSPIQSLVTRQGKTLQPNLELSRYIMGTVSQAQLQNTAVLDPDDPSGSFPQWHLLVSRNSPDEIWVNLAWPEGLFVALYPDATVNMPIRMRFRRRGTVAWTNCPEIHFSYNKASSFQKVIKLKWGPQPINQNPPPTAQGPVYAYKATPGQSAPVTPTIAGWAADSWFSAGAGNDLLSNATLLTSNVKNTELYSDGVVFYLDEGTFPKDFYEIQLKGGYPYPPNPITVQGVSGGTEPSFVPSTYTLTYVATGTSTHTSTGVWFQSNAVSAYFTQNDIVDFFSYYTSASLGGLPRVIFEQNTVHNRVIVTRLSSVWLQNPIQSEDFATISIRVRNRALGAVSVLAAGYVNDWDGSGWNNLTTTSNPAPHYRDVMVGSLNSDPLPVDMVDDDSLVAWRQNCIDRGYTCDAVIDGKAGSDVLTAIAACGYARPRLSEKWGVLLDKDRSDEAPVQIFSPRNMNSFRFERAFAILPTGMRVRYDEKINNYEENPIIVLDPDAAGTDQVRLEDTRYDGLVTLASAMKRALFDMAQVRKRLIFFYGTAPIEALVAQRGDLVGVQHDVINQEAGFARVKQVIVEGGNAVGLVTDGTLPTPNNEAFSNASSAFLNYTLAFSSPEMGVAIRLTDGTTIIKEITGPDEESDFFMFSTPFEDTPTLAPDCLVVSGKIGQEYSRMILFGATAKNDQTCDLTFVPEAPELWGNLTAMGIIRTLGLTDEAVLVLDAGDGASYTSGQKWLDTSGNHNDFFFGLNAQ